MAKRHTVPSLYYGNVPESQMLALNLVGHSLDNLEYFSANFSAALKLFDFCKKQRASRLKPPQHYRSWQFVAARDGAISMHNFSDAIAALKEAASACQYIADRLDVTSIKALQDKFNRTFPNSKRVRHSVGHAGEKTKGLDQHKKHGFKGSYNRGGLKIAAAHGAIVIDHLHGRTFSNSWHGQIETYRISKKTLSQLQALKYEIYDLFDEMNLRFPGT